MVQGWDSWPPEPFLVCVLAFWSSDLFDGVVFDLSVLGDVDFGCLACLVLYIWLSS